MEEKTGKIHGIILALTLFFGFIFRLINVHTRVMYGDPAHFVVNAINFLNSGLLSLWDQSTFLWYALTNIFYNIFGITQFASRFSSLLFGTFTILAVYLFVKEFSGNKTIALISAILYSFAPTLIFNTADEHDISLIFFLVTSFYCLVRGLNKSSRGYLALSAVFIGLACMLKAYVPILFIPYFGFILYYSYSKRFDLKKNYKFVIFLAFVIFLLAAPTLVYNYSNYKHNEVATFFFVKFFSSLYNEKAHQLYDWVSYGELSRGGNIFTRLFFDSIPSNGVSDHAEIYTGLASSLYSNGPLLCLLSLLSLIFLFIQRKKDKFARDYLVFYLLYFIVPFLFLIDGNTLSKHYIQFIVFALPMIAYLIYSLFLFLSTQSGKLNNLFSKKYFWYFFFALTVLFEFFVLLSLPFAGSELLFSPNPEGQFMSYKLANIPSDSFIIYDDRLYNSQAAWLFNDRYYIPVSLLSEFMNYNDQSSGREPVSVYVIECATDDCGWGTVSQNPELNSSMESFFDSIKNQSIPQVESIKSKLEGKPYYNPLINSRISGQDYLLIYRTRMNIDLNLAKQVSMQYNSFMYPVAYKNVNDKVFQNFVYSPDSAVEILLNKFAWLVFYLEIFMAFAALLFILYEIYIYF